MRETLAVLAVVAAVLLAGWLALFLMSPLPVPRQRLTPEGARASRRARRFVVVVPYRDTPGQGRAAQLDRLRARFRGVAEVLVVEQTREGKFNRGALLNAGVDLLPPDGDGVVLHDVDLLPDDDAFSYYGLLRPVHLANRWVKYKHLRDDLFLGGVVGMARETFLAAGGFPNNLWGWGGEDDELCRRLSAASLRVANPTTGAYVDLQRGLTQDNPSWRCLDRPPPRGGARDVRYDVVARRELEPGITAVTVRLPAPRSRGS